MSMIDAIPLLAGAGADGYQISRSVRLRSSASAYLNRTFTTPTNVLKWSWSGWVKRGQIGVTYAPIFAGGTSGSAYAALWFNNDNLVLYSYNGATVYQLTTSAVYRDPSAWYHIQIAFDSTQATASNRLAMYVNGVQITTFAAATYPSLNYSGFMNSAIAHYFGQFTPALGASYFDGYLTEVNFIDGQALTPSSFGETNLVTGVWQPKRYAGTYGTNGFYLNFSDNSGVTATTIGKDYSGNGNNWTPSAGISITAGATYDSMLDVPTLYADGGNGRGNYATLNPLISASYQTLSNANLTSKSNTSTDSGASYSTITTGITGLWYCEFTANTSAGGGYPIVGTWDTSLALPTGNGGSYTPGATGSTAHAGYLSSGNKLVNGASTAFGSSYVTNDVIGVAIDCTNGAIYFSKNNTWQNSGVPTSGASKTGAATTWTGSTKEFLIGLASFVSGTGADANFGQRPFTYTPPTGFKALNTQNLPTPTISKGNQYMDVVLYTGNAASPRTISGAGFQPDFIWDKSRSARSHTIWDSVRGVGVSKELSSNLTDAEGGANISTAVQGYISAITADGFTMTSGSSAINAVNANGENFVAWLWNAGGSTVTNTSGSISAQVRANPTAGFSVVTYTGTGANATVGHGLGVAPNMVLYKKRNGAYDGCVYHKSITAAKRLILFSTSSGTLGEATDSTFFQSTDPSSSVLYLGTREHLNGAYDYVAYCFAAVAGYSAFGKYTGNGVPDGPFVYLGFRPRWLMIKRSSSASVTYGWQMYDTSRQPVNTASSDPNLWADTSAAEGTGNYTFDLLSNGFKLRSSGVNENASGDTYIYAAFAEVPFKVANAR